ncbi:ATP-binding protein [Streptomyces sp. NPDC048507]|uniref:ATP-binding protein n=1 Tax=Streptomyces sp. NPDC048507 TaxID=3365560 RepID=UPI0037192A1F
MNTTIARGGRPATVHLELPPDAEAAGLARRRVALLLAAHPAGCPRLIAEDVVLIASELVTNAVLHAEGPYALTLSVDEGRVGVAVSDASSALPRRCAGHAGDRQGGRGLEIIRGLGADLFVSPSGSGKQVIAVLAW